MSSDRPSGDPSPAADDGIARADASLVRLRGAPLLEALETHSRTLREHSESVAAYAFAAAVELGLDRAACELVREAARLHEVGQVYAGGTGEFGQRQEETYRLCHGAAVDEEICAWLLRTRERFDGQGPEGIAGSAIPIESRLIRAACALQIALSDPGREAEAPARERGIERIRSQAGAELDHEAVAALVAVVKRGTLFDSK